MRLISMNRIALAATLLFATLPALAQLSAPPNSGAAFKDTSMVKAPPGARVAIYDFEDLECPACAHAYPHRPCRRRALQDPLVRHDFPLKMHIWSFDAAVVARYMQDKISPQARRRLSPRRLRQPDLHRLQGRSQQLHAEVLPLPRPRDALRRRSLWPLHR